MRKIIEKKKSVWRISYFFFFILIEILCVYFYYYSLSFELEKINYILRLFIVIDIYEEKCKFISSRKSVFLNKKIKKKIPPNNKNLQSLSKQVFWPPPLKNMFAKNIFFGRLPLVLPFVHILNVYNMHFNEAHLSYPVVFKGSLALSTNMTH